MSPELQHARQYLNHLLRQADRAVADGDQDTADALYTQAEAQVGVCRSLLYQHA